MPIQHPLRALLFCSIPLLCITLLNPTSASALPQPPQKPMHKTISTTKKPRLPRKLSQNKNDHTTRGKVRLTVKLVYAYTRARPSVDRRLQRDLPSLRKIYDFNTYRLVRILRHSVAYKQALIVPISSNYQVQLSPQHYNGKERKIAIQTTFLHRLRPKNARRAKFSAYATASIRLQNGGKVAFLGPAYRYGRALLILRARRK